MPPTAAAAVAAQVDVVSAGAKNTSPWFRFGRIVMLDRLRLSSKQG